MTRKLLDTIIEFKILKRKRVLNVFSGGRFYYKNMVIDKKDSVVFKVWFPGSELVSFSDTEKSRILIKHFKGRALKSTQIHAFPSSLCVTSMVVTGSGVLTLYGISKNKPNKSIIITGSRGFRS